MFRKLIIVEFVAVLECFGLRATTVILKEGKIFFYDYLPPNVFTKSLEMLISISIYFAVAKVIKA